MFNAAFPLPYRWLIARNLVDWTPWYFLDDLETIQKSPDFARSEFFEERLRIETGKDLDVFLFARRQDMETFAFFAVRDGQIEDFVIPIHLSFSRSVWPRTPFEWPPVEKRLGLVQWIKEDVLSDVNDWMSDEDL